MGFRFIYFSVALFLLGACFPFFPASLSVPAPEVGAAAPDFTLKDLTGANVRLSDLRGQVVLANFWATWCGPCRIEMPTIQERYNDGGFAVLAINFDESTDKIQDFVDGAELTLFILLDPGGKIQELYRVRGYPSSYFIDADGVIQFIHIGEMSGEDLNKYLTEMGVNR